MNHVETLIEKYRSSGVFIDTELLVLFLVGSVDANNIRNFGRTAKYTEEDFNKVSAFIESFRSKITNPYVLAETSNHLGRSNDYRIALKTYIDLFLEEKCLAAKELVHKVSYCEIGLADTSIIETSKDTYLIFTADNRFNLYLSSVGIDAVSLDDLKSEFLN
jgi:hypothetical protein